MHTSAVSQFFTNLTFIVVQIVYCLSDPDFPAIDFVDIINARVSFIVFAAVLALSHTRNTCALLGLTCAVYSSSSGTPLPSPSLFQRLLATGPPIPLDGSIMVGLDPSLV